ncbi:unnamed protein product [Parascedosporium putredinis]|uniref:Uncharacterized protein n=1 Tax=Parascedosporium putredinis TaxID=1442378 RepID=A0A9P1H1I0_9PEZI|nr:unnamed protein product [Parascedosporium putredinis]CAI7993757.1 unnamed protein product [Parascedosporium putredinis]
MDGRRKAHPHLGLVRAALLCCLWFLSVSALDFDYDRPTFNGAPEGWEDAAPGDILRTRPEGLADCPIPYCAGTYQFLYRSSDTHGDPSWAVATVFYSNVTAPGCAADPADDEDCVQGVVTYDAAYDSSSLDGSPSYTLQWGDPAVQRDGVLSRYAVPSFYVLIGYAGQNVYDYFENGEDDVMQGPIRELFDTEGAMGIHGIPNMPVFYHKAEVDEMSPIEETDVMVQHFCDHGANILYHRNELGDHNKELWAGRLRALDFIGKVTYGVGEIEIPETGCLWQNVTVDLPDWDEIATGRAVRGVAPQLPEEPEEPVEEEPPKPKKCVKKRRAG